MYGYISVFGYNFIANMPYNLPLLSMLLNNYASLTCAISFAYCQIILPWNFLLKFYNVTYYPSIFQPSNDKLNKIDVNSSSMELTGTKYKVSLSVCL